ncbi:hypothetical protein ACFY12_34965 [Streptomyces sp. NPDC001339]|uniref:phage tail protein n=1 Tax=Streptomyces sp. NPDC001339 TaxID=3364563 RepID=UPI003692E2B5
MAGPGGREADRVSVRVVPDTSRFAADLRDALERTEHRARVKVPVFPDLSQFKDRLRTELRTPIYARATVPVVPSLRGFGGRLRTELRTMGALPVPVQPTTNALAIARLRAELAHLAPPILVPVRIQGDRRSNNSAASALDRLRSVAAGLGGMAGTFGKIAAAIGAAVPVAAGLTAALQGIAPAAALAATGIVGIATATAALKIGTLGVGDALKNAFDPKNAAQFNEALATLTPNARAFVLALQGAQPQFTAVRTAVQQRLFDGLASQITNAGAVALPVLRRGLVGAAGALNEMGRGVLLAVRQLSSSGQLGQALAGANRGLSNLSRIPGQFVTGLTQIAAAAGPVFGQLTELAGGAADRLAGKLSKAFASGQLTTFITNAVAMVQQLLTVLGNVGSIVNSVFSAAQTSGSGFLGTLQTITGAMKTAFASPAVQGGLKALYATMGQLAQTAAPLLGQALRVVGQVLSQLGPPAQTLIKALGSALQPVIKALGPVLATVATAVGNLVVAFAPLLTAVGNIIAALLPAIQPVVGALGRVFKSLTPVISQLASGIGTYLGPVLSGLASVIAKLISGYADQLVVIFNSLAPIMPALASAMGQVGAAIGQLFMAVAPLLPQLTQLGTQLAAQLLPALLPLIPPIARLSAALISMGVGAITQYAIPALQKLITFITGLQRFLAPAIAAVKWVVNGISAAFEWLYDHLVGHSVIPDMVRGIVSWLASLPGKALSAIASLPGFLAGKAEQAGSQFLAAVRGGLGQAVDWISNVPSMAVNALGNIGSLLWDAGASLIQGFVAGIQSMIGSIRSTLGDITDSLTSWKGPPTRDARILRPAGHLVMSGFMDGITDSVPDLRAQLRGVTSEVAAYRPTLAPQVETAATAVAMNSGAPSAPVVSIDTFVAHESQTPAGIARELAWLAKGRG